MHRMLALTLLGTVVLGVGQAQDDKKKPTPNKAEQSIVTLLNKVRAREKLPQLKMNENLFGAARAYSISLAKAGKLAHDLDGKNHFERARKAGYDKNEVYGVIAGGPNLAPAQALGIWGKSEMERGELLSDKFAEIGVGIVRDRQGRIFYTVLLGGAGASKSNPELGLDRFAEEAQKILELTNKERAKEKLPPLKWNATLAKTAQGHSINMAAQNKLAHELDGKNPYDRIKAAGYKYLTAGENCAYSFKPDMQLIVERWMKSPPHRKNILHPKYTEIGIALARSDKGDFYATQVFGTPE